MKLEIVNTSIVVLANQFNVGLLHPAYLETWGIANEDWVAAAPPIATQLFSTIEYTNGLVFSLQSNKFQLLDGNPSQESTGKSLIPEISVAYLRKLPETNYTAAGINMVGFVEHTSPEAALLALFLKPQIGTYGTLAPKDAAIRLTYDIDEARLNLGYEAGTIQKPQDIIARNGIIVNANYHIGITSGKIQDIENAISHFAQYVLRFTDLVNRMLELE